MDPVGSFIANLHRMLGHDTAAAFIGAPAGDKSACPICQYEREPTDDRRQAVVDAIGTARAS